MKKKGFTLIEVLAVIAVLAIILLIAVPKISDVTLSAKKEAFKTSNASLVNKVKQLGAERVLDSEYTITNGVISPKLDVSGDIPKTGLIKIDEDGNIKLYTEDDDFCAVKNFTDKKIYVYKKEDANCNLLDDEKVNLIIHLNGGSTSQTLDTKYLKGNSIKVENPTRFGYSFSGWTVSGENASMKDKILTMGNSDTTISANYIAGDVTFAVNLDGGTTTQVFNKTYKFAEKISLINPTKEGYTFTGWVVTGKYAKLESNVLTMGENTVLKATWKKATVTLSVKLNGGNLSETIKDAYNVGEKVSLASPTKEGYTFNGWKVVSGKATAIKNEMVDGSFENGVFQNSVVLPSSWTYNLSTSTSSNLIEGISVYDSFGKFGTHSLMNYHADQWGAFYTMIRNSKPGHIYYYSAYVNNKTFGLQGSETRPGYNDFSFFYNDTHNWGGIYSGQILNTWEKTSIIRTAPSNTSTIYLALADSASTNKAQHFYVDGVMIIDLTMVYGSGNEPTKEWMDSNVDYFDENLILLNDEDVLLEADWTPRYHLDLNGYLDGVEGPNITGFGTADIYINGSLWGWGVGITDFYTAFDKGTTYEIKNIKMTAGHAYKGVHYGSLSGTLNDNTGVTLAFETVNTAAPTCTVTVSGTTITGTYNDEGGVGIAYYGFNPNKSGTSSTTTTISSVGAYTFYVVDNVGKEASCSVSVVDTNKVNTYTCKTSCVGGSCYTRGSCKTYGKYYCKSSTGNACLNQSCCNSENGIWTRDCTSYYWNLKSSPCSSGWSYSNEACYKYNQSSCSTGSVAGTSTTYTCTGGYNKINDSYCYKLS